MGILLCCGLKSSANEQRWERKGGNQISVRRDGKLVCRVNQVKMKKAGKRREEIWRGEERRGKIEEREKERSGVCVELLFVLF